MTVSLMALFHGSSIAAVLSNSRCQAYTVLPMQAELGASASFYCSYKIVHTKTRYQQSSSSWNPTKGKLPVGYNL